MVAPQNSKGEASVEPHQKCCDDHKQCGQACGYEIGHVIQPRGELAKVEITIRAIADHGVERVNSFVSHCQRNATQKKIEERGDYTVAGIFGQRFQAGAENFVFVQSGGIPSYDMAKILSRLNEIARSQWGFDADCSVKQPAGGQSRGRKSGCEKKSNQRRQKRE